MGWSFLGLRDECVDGDGWEGEMEVGVVEEEGCSLALLGDWFHSPWLPCSDEVDWTKSECDLMCRSEMS